LRVRLLPSLAGCLLTALAGCAQDPSDNPAPLHLVVLDPPYGPTEPQLPNDGLWKGSVSEKGDVTTCPHFPPGTVEVGDNTVVVGYRPSLILIATAADDGALQAAAGETKLDGAFAGNVLNFTVSDGTCESQFALSRLGGM
jgi:hypothetical protein